MLKHTAILLTLCTLAAPGAGEDADTARAYLAKALNDPLTVDTALAALASTKDRDLVPLFVAASRSRDRDRRLMGIRALSELAGKDAAPALLKRLRYDQETTVRTEALRSLLKLKAVSAEQLEEALKIPDERVQLLAARALMRKGRPPVATKTLRDLVRSKELVISSHTRMTLLGAGYREHLSELRRILGDPQTPLDVVGSLMDQITKEKITAAIGLGSVVAESALPDPLKLRAYRGISAVSPHAADAIAEAISKSPNTRFSAGLLKILAACPDAGNHLESLGEGKDIVGALARLELTRQTGGEAARRAVHDAMGFGDPIVAEYVVELAREDVKAGGSQVDFYTPALLACIRSDARGQSNVGNNHLWTMPAATLLADIGSPAAMAGLEQILQGPQTGAKRIILTGLMQTKNSAVCSLVRGLLESPHSQLASGAALLLGRFAHPEAPKYLLKILAGNTNPPIRVGVPACWFLLKIENQAPAAAKILADSVK